MKTAPKNSIILLALVAAGVGIVLAANPSWFTVNNAYGTMGVSAPLTATSYGRSQAVDRNDTNHGHYSLVTALPKNTNGYYGPYSIARRTSTGALDMSFAASGVTTSFANYSDATYQFHDLCIDPLTHNLLVVGNIQNTATAVIERLTPPAANGIAALDATFNPQGTTPGVVMFSGPVDNNVCAVTGDQSILIAGRDRSTPSKAVVVRVLVGGTLDQSFGTNGMVTFALANGENWEGGGPIEWNSSQTIAPDIIILGDTYPTGNSSSTTAALLALNACTGTPDANFNSTGFMSVPVIDANTYSFPFVGSILADGSIHVGLIARGSFNVDLVAWSYPVTAANWQLPTAPGTVTPPASVSLGGNTASAAPVRQFDGSILISAETASNHEALFEVVGDSSLGFTVAAPAPFNCGPTVAVPNVVGQTQAAATTAITGAGLTVGAVTQQSSSTVASGSVISESPVAGTQVARGSAVNLIVSTGPAQVAVPNVVGQTQAAATTAITGAGLTVGTVMQQSSTAASGSVISQNPAAGTNVASGSAVNLVVSSGGGGGGGGGGGAFDTFTLGALLSALIVGLRRARKIAK